MVINHVETLQAERSKLIRNFIQFKEPVFLEKHAMLLDQYFRDGFERSVVGPKLNLNKKPFAIIALGGYGRKEQYIHSDVDLLFLYQSQVPNEAEDLVREMLYPLWDKGFDIGYATRTLKECIQLSQSDVEVLTSILDARFICGMSNLYIQLMEMMRDKVLAPSSDKTIRHLIARNQDRHKRFGDCSYLLEPNLKEGQGGLRDFHTMFWIARVKSNTNEYRELEYQGYLSHGEYIALMEALDFIRSVRNHLHYMADRKCDQLYFEHQIKLAQILKFDTQDNKINAVEAFLAQLHSMMRLIKQHHVLLLVEFGFTKRLTLVRRIFPKKTKVSGLKVEKAFLTFVSTEELMASPEILIRIFEESARLKIPLSSEARRVVTEFLYLVDGQYRRKYLKNFEHVLMMPPTSFNVINEMLETGLLQQFLPQFMGIVHFIQYDEYHLYPVDIHLIHTVKNIKRFGLPEGAENDPLGANLYQELTHQQRKELIWSGLLHDIGKEGSGKDHSEKGAVIATTLLSELGMNPAAIESITFLVREHLYLIKIATRRDITDEEVIIACARHINDIDRLKMIYLLTVADSISTGPKAWNDWSAALLRDLFLKVSKLIVKGELVSSEVFESIETKKRNVLAHFTDPKVKSEVEQLFGEMSQRYFLDSTENDIIEHIRLYQKLAGNAFNWMVQTEADSNTRWVTICAKDSAGLFSKISGVFTLNGFDILNARIYTWRNQTAVDIFVLNPPVDQIFEESRWEKTKADLEMALSNQLDLENALEKQHPQTYLLERKPQVDRKVRVEINNQESSFFTIVEVIANDFPGLLYCITDALYDAEVDVRIAKIATKADQVMDVFYVRDFYGEKVDAPEKIAMIKEAIIATVSSNL